MRIRYARLRLPPRMKATAAADARQIAETVARAISAQHETSPGAPGRLTVEIQGLGRPSRHMRLDLTAATSRALRATAGRI